MKQRSASSSHLLDPHCFSRGLTLSDFSMPRVPCSRFFKRISAAASFVILAWIPISAEAAPGPSPSDRPSAPMAPATAKSRQVPENPFRCDRLIKFRGKILSCDSALRRDGESLRSIFESTPEALDELDEYQAGRKSIKFAAYSGTAGVVIALASGLIGNLIVPDENKQGDRDAATRIVRLSGLGITLGSVVFGLSHLRNNEEHLKRAIIKYNGTHTDRPIEVLFQTEF